MRIVTEDARPTADAQPDTIPLPPTNSPPTVTAPPREAPPPPELSAAFEELLRYLADPHRTETAAMWEAVVRAKLGPLERAQAERLAPVVKAYLSREIEREEYEQRLVASTVPTP